MKSKIKYYACVFVLFITMSVPTKAAIRGKGEVVTIQTSAICESCKNRIEKALKASDGVMEANLNLKNKRIKVKYDPAKLTPDQVRTLISKTGYDADGVKADPTSYNNLPKCCQKGGDKEMHMN
jgi:mercuric ion binding protein